MAEVLGTALGLVGAIEVLGQIFDGCIKAYVFFTTASDLGRDSERLVCKIRIEGAGMGSCGGEVRSTSSGGK